MTSFTSELPVWIISVSFLCLTALVGTSCTALNKMHFFFSYSQSGEGKVVSLLQLNCCKILLFFFCLFVIIMKVGGLCHVFPYYFDNNVDPSLLLLCVSLVVFPVVSPWDKSYWVMVHNTF